MTIGTFIQNYWTVIISLVGIGISWWRITIKLATKQALDDERLKDVADKTIKMEARIDAIFPDINTIKTDVAVMKNTLEYIKGSITQISTGSIQIQK